MTDIKEIKDQRVVCGPAETKAPVVIFLHGYGSSGPAMAAHVGGLLQKSGFHGVLRFPSGPLEVGRDHHGNSYHSWIDIQDFVKADHAPDAEDMARRASAGSAALAGYVRRVMAEEGVGADQVVLAGFSLGGTMALYTGLSMKEGLSGIFNLSGGAAFKTPAPESLKPVILLAAGEKESAYSGVENMNRAYPVLQSYGLKVDHVTLRHQGHDISPKSMKILTYFVQRVTEAGPRPAGPGL